MRGATGAYRLVVHWPHRHMRRTRRCTRSGWAASNRRSGLRQSRSRSGKGIATCMAVASATHSAMIPRISGGSSMSSLERRQPGLGRLEVVPEVALVAAVGIRLWLAIHPLAASRWVVTPRWGTPAWPILRWEPCLRACLELSPELREPRQERQEQQEVPQPVQMGPRAWPAVRRCPATQGCQGTQG